MRFCLLIIVLTILSACSPKPSGDRSKISLNIPTLAQLNAKPAGALNAMKTTALAGDIRWENACFMVTVNANDIPNPSAGTCDLPSGYFRGSVPPSSTSQPTSLVLDEVPKGESRRFDVYAYFHTSGEKCPTELKNINLFNKARVARLGSANQVSLQKDSEELLIDISFPTRMIVADANLPATCSSLASTGATGLRSVSASNVGQKTVLNGYTVNTTTGGASKRMLATPSGYSVYRKRGIAQ